VTCFCIIIFLDAPCGTITSCVLSESINRTYKKKIKKGGEKYRKQIWFLIVFFRLHFGSRKLFDNVGHAVILSTINERLLSLQDSLVCSQFLWRQSINRIVEGLIHCHGGYENGYCKSFTNAQNISYEQGDIFNVALLYVLAFTNSIDGKICKG